MSDLINKQELIAWVNYLINHVSDCKVGTGTFKDGLMDGYCRIRSIVKEFPSAQQEQHEIGYFECANVMLKMWNDNILTNGEYKHIMSKLNAHWAERRKDGKD